MAAPGTLLEPADLTISALVQARDPGGFWYNAKVIGKSGRGASFGVVVRYTGFGPSHDEKFTKAKAGLRTRLSAADLKEERELKRWNGCVVGRRPDGTWEVERILEQVGRGFRVRWAGWGPESDSVEPRKNLTPDMIEEFEEEQQALAKLRAKPPKVPPPPFTAALTADESDEVREWRVLDTDELVADISLEAGVKLTKTKTALAEGKIYQSKPVSAGAFRALRTRFARAALAAQPDRDVDRAVTPVASLRRGVRPVDTFSVMDDDVLNAELGAGVYMIRSDTGAAVKLVAPADFFLKAKRDAAGALLPVKELMVKAHFVALVPDHAHPEQPIFRTDHTAFEYPQADVDAYERAMAGKLLADASAPAAFRAWALAVPPAEQ